jgi:two-component system sensor histidine kinase KdpD
MNTRPDPDDLLERVMRDEERQARGRLKIFFGFSAGVGKTFAMLEAAQALAAQGTDVIAGVVETHGRAETEAQLAGLRACPRRCRTAIGSCPSSTWMPHWNASPA